LLGAAARPALHKITHTTLDTVLDEAMLAAAITCSRRGADPPTFEDIEARRSWAGMRVVDGG
jgi:fructokinase